MTGFSPTSPVVSVLMAVHDGGSTVRRAIESLQAQTLSNFEVVVVDAGSTDGTSRLLDTMSERDIRIDVTHVEDCGISQGLELALSRARGNYLLVMHDGAWAEPALLSELVGAAEESDLQLAIGGFTVNVVYGGRELALEAEAPQKTFLTQHDFRAAAWSLFDAGLLAPACAKLYDRRFAAEKGVGFEAVAGPESVEGNDASSAGHAFELAFLRDVERVGLVGTTRYHTAVSLGFPAMFPAAGATFGRLEREYAATLELFGAWGMEGDAASMGMIQRRYVELLASCIDAIAGEGPLAPQAAQVERISNMIATDRAQLAASVARPQDGFVRAMLPSIKSGNARKAYAQAKLWALLRHGAPASLAPDAYV